MVLWTHSVPAAITIEDCFTNKKMKANTVAAADVLWSPDKTMQLVLKNTLCVLSLSLSPSSPFRLCLSSDDPSSFSSCKHV